MGKEGASTNKTHGGPILEILRGLAPDERAAALIRHSVRPRADPGHEGTLTPEGHEAARTFGTSLPRDIKVFISHSPVRRCEQTAEDIAEGFKAQYPGGDVLVTGVEPWLRTFYHFAHDPQAMEEVKAQMGGKSFLRAWIDGTLPPGLMEPAVDASRTILRNALTGLANSRSRTVHLFVGHDFGLLLLREHLFGGRFEELPWTDYLDGIVIVPKPDGELHAKWQTTTVRVRAID